MLEKAMEQAENDRKEQEKAVVFHRKDRKSWLVTMKLEDWMELFQAYEKQI